MELARSLRIKSMTLEVRISNAPARALYENAALCARGSGPAIIRTTGRTPAFIGPNWGNNAALAKRRAYGI